MNICSWLNPPCYPAFWRCEVLLDLKAAVVGGITPEAVVVISAMVWRQYAEREHTKQAKPASAVLNLSSWLNHFFAHFSNLLQWLHGSIGSSAMTVYL